MTLFELIGEIVIKNKEALEALETTQDEAKKTGETVKESNKKVKESNKSTESSWTTLKSKVAEYKTQGMSTSQAWKKASQDMKSDTENAENGMTSAFKKIGAAVATYLTVDAIKNFGLSCIQAAADANAASSQFSQVFGDLESEASESLSSIADEAGISENRMKGSFTKIAAFAKTTGMDTESALELSERAMIAVADSAAFYDRSLEETTESLQSFLKGNYENDAALGLSCTEVTRNAAANELYGKSFNDLSESQKQLTLLQMVEDANAASGALGQAARESDTWTNVTGNLKQAWTDFQSVLGSNILPVAVDAVKSMVGVVEDWTAKLPELINWCKEHETTLQVIGILVGTLTTAIIAFNIAQNASAIATALATTAMSAYGAVMAFVTSPITLVVVAIGALIAIGVLLYKNWDTIKEKCGELWSNVKEKFSDLKEAVVDKVTELKDKAIDKFNELKDKASTAASNLKDKASSAWNTLKDKTSSAFSTAKDSAVSAWNTLKDKVSSTATSAKDSVSTAWSNLKEKTSSQFNEAKDKAATAFSSMKSSVIDLASSAGTQVGNKFNSMKSTISLAVSNVKSLASSAFSSMKSSISTAVSGAYDSVKSSFDSIKTKISSVMESAKSIVSTAIDKIKSAFNISLKLDIKLPHITVYGGEAPYGIGGKGSLPSFSVEWYAKAMNNAMVLSDPTIFGYANGKMLGAGEAGNEVVAGEAHLMNLIGQVVESKTAGQNDRIIEILIAILNAITGGNEEMLRALLSGQKFVVGEREFARLVRTYA